MQGQIMIDFGAPDREPVPGAVHRRIPAPAPPRVPGEPAGDATSQDDSLPALRLLAGYELYRDATRTVLRVPGEERWSATIRTGPTSHRFVAAGPDPETLWRAALGAPQEHGARPVATPAPGVGP
jgi:hypothetical protein